jgi:alpha-1,3-mannosyl-glycoprotein beta-1,2-N-acetylglucosaminyltransferase
MAYNRPEYLRRTLSSLLGLAGIEKLRVYVSQDGDNKEVSDVIASELPRFPVSGGKLSREHRVSPKTKPQSTAFLAQHYGQALGTLFGEKQHEFVIIVEDDLVFSPDFVRYFEVTADLLRRDETLLCVSSWNDNGMESTKLSPTRLLRTSFFPGLGWMLHRRLWQEIGPKWPLDHWDHWLRMSPIHKGRDCIVPELPRNRNIGEVGATMSKGEFDRFLRNVAFNTDPTASDRLGNLDYLARDAYEANIVSLLARAEDVARNEASEELFRDLVPDAVVVVPYLREEYQRYSRMLGIFPNPRGHYKLATVIRTLRGATVILVDARMSPLCPAALRVPARTDLRATKAPESTSCTATCATANLVCDASQFEYINTCEALQAVFPCEEGCRLVVGPDIPNYVYSTQDTQAKMCLITDDVSTCEAAHRFTQRLCPCVNRS